MHKNSDRTGIKFKCVLSHTPATPHYNIQSKNQSPSPVQSRPGAADYMAVLVALRILRRRGFRFSDAIFYCCL